LTVPDLVAVSVNVPPGQTAEDVEAAVTASGIVTEAVTIALALWQVPLNEDTYQVVVELIEVV
jgi:hypothetical protein